MRGNWKNSIKSLSLVIMILCLAGSAHAVELDKIQKRYASMEDFTATFNQETFQVIASKNVKFEGKVSYKRGAGVRMDVSYPERQILILRGSMVLVILPDQGTSQVQEVPPEIATQNILGFFTGLSSINEYYAVQTVDDHLVLLPKSGTGSISVWVDAGNLIQRVLLKDAMGNTSDIRLGGYRFNTGISDGFFHEKIREQTGQPQKAPGKN